MGNVTLASRCNTCRAKASITVPAAKWTQDIEGALVQIVFPDLTPADRELVIASRVGFYTCSTCWDHACGDDE